MKQALTRMIFGMNIVLVHGILGFHKVLGFEYFHGIVEHFKQFRILAPQLDPTSGFEVRGQQLQDKIMAAFTAGALDPTQKTHIIAHSLGGLDSRFMLSPANPNRIKVPIHSLTTISTPHHGTPVADLLDSATTTLFPHLPFAGETPVLEAALNHLNISLDGLRDLTTSRCEAFNNQYINHPDVGYFSVAGSGRGKFPETSAAFLLFYHYILAKTGQSNDGMVPVESAQFETFDAETWPGDHGEEIGYNLDNLVVPPEFYLDRYDRIVATLMNL